MATPDDLFPDNLDRMTLLERAQQLHDVTLRRHEVWHHEHLERMARYDDMHQEHLRRMAHLEDMIDRQQHMQAELMTIQRAILDILRRQNGHP